MDKVVLGFANTVDYELQWDLAHLEELIRRTGLHQRDIEEKKEIITMKDLLSSILFHMMEGTGCGRFTENPEVIEEFIKGTKYRVALGGTNMRAAEIISVLGGDALVHLVSINDDTIEKMPHNIRWVGGEQFQCCFPHIAIQFPKNVRVRVNDIDIMVPRENRVIYSGDTACAQMPLNKEFFVKAADAKAILLSSFDLITNEDILTMRILEIKTQLNAWGKKKPLVFYEHACFADEKFGDWVRSELGSFIDVYSMNEDEFQALIGRKVDMLDVNSVMAGIKDVHERISAAAIIVHTSQWALISGNRTKELEEALKYGMLTASTRYWRGTVSRDYIQVTEKLPLQEKAKKFAKRIETHSGQTVRCLPAAEINEGNPTTIGLGDSFVGGFLWKYCFNITGREA